MLWNLCWILWLKLWNYWPQLWHMVEKNKLGQLGFCWNVSSTSWRCMHGLCLRIKLLFNLNAGLLDLCWSNLFSENLTLLFSYIKSIMIIRTSVFGNWESIEIIPMCIQNKNTLKNQLQSMITVVERLSYFHLMSFSYIHQLTCMNNSINLFSASNKRTSRS
jgi:hypothetical protein